MISPHLAGGRLTIDLSALAANWRLLAEKSKPGRAAAVVKADGYGLGIEPVVKTLAAECCDTFFVALPEEAFAVRRIAPKVDVFLLNGIHAESVHSVHEARVMPVLSSLDQIALWAEHNTKRGTRFAAAVHVDTGMNRLGLTVDEALTFARRNAEELVIPCFHVMSHFACADDPDHPLNAAQIKLFQKVAAAFKGSDSSLSNSAGILNGGAHGGTMTRPGIAMYGGEAVNGIDNPMATVVTLEGRIAQIRHARKGETVSYGGTVTLSRDTKIAVVSVGYADGYMRAGSGAGVPLRDAVLTGAQGFIGGHKVPVLGRVTMDLTCFDVTDVPDAALAGGWIELIGENVKLDDAARAAGTIGYEMLTGLGKRYARQYRKAGA